MKVSRYFLLNKGSIIAYSAALFLCVIFTIFSLNLWNADLSIPFHYSWDTLYTSASIKGFLENGSIWENSNIGMPFGSATYDFRSTSDSMNLIFVSFIKVISLFTPNYAIILNLWFILTFPLTTLITLLVFRHFEFQYPYAVVGSLLYTFLPYHFLRGELHLTLSSYFLVPLSVLVIIWIYLEKPIFFQNLHDEEKSRKLIFLNSYTLISIVICLLLACSSVYYAFFSCFLLLTIGFIVSFMKRIKYPFVASILLATVIAGGIICTQIPSITYQHEYGINPYSVSIRDPIQSEIYGLKITQLFLPIYGHRIPFFSNITQNYMAVTPVGSEPTMNLGLIGSLGCIFLIFWLFYRIINTDNFKPDLSFNILNCLALINILALLLWTVGGFWIFFAYLNPIFASIRCVNRISIYIAFISIFAFILILRKLIEKQFSQKRYYEFICLTILGIILLGGFLDQTSNNYIPKYDKIKDEFIDEQNFIGEIENILPKNAMVYQLPFIPYPENPPVYKMQDYEHFKAYLHSRQLRWSYGSMKGRAGSLWQKDVSQKSIEEMVDTLILTGFSGIYIDTNGYPDGGEYIISGLSDILGKEPIRSQSSRFFFFDLTEDDKQITNWIEYIYFDGWHYQEVWSGVPTRWMTEEGTLLVYSYENQSIALNFSLTSNYQPRTLIISLNDQDISKDVVSTNFTFKSFSIPLTLHKGENIVRFYSEEGCERPLNSKDNRCLSFAFQNITLV